MKTLTLTLALMVISTCAHAQGTIVLANSTLATIKLSVGLGETLDAPVGTVVGVFWGETPNNLTLSLPTVEVTSAGLFNAGVYGIPGTSPGQRVYLVIAAWFNRLGPTPATIDRGNLCAANITDYGESAMVSATLGNTTGPGTVIWQGQTGTNPERMKPFVMQPLVQCPEPSVVALGVIGLAALLMRRRSR